MDLNPLIRQIKLPSGKDNLYLVANCSRCVLPKLHTRLALPSGDSCLSLEAQEDPEKYRFQVELEFVQCLANPQYLNCKYCTAIHDCSGESNSMISLR